jgi:hypothetical protein
VNRGAPGAAAAYVDAYLTGRHLQSRLVRVGQVLHHRGTTAQDVHRRGGSGVGTTTRACSAATGDTSLTNGVAVGSPAAVRCATRVTLAPAVRFAAADSTGLPGRAGFVAAQP